MGWLDSVFGKKKPTGSTDPFGIFSDDPIGSTIKNLARQHAEAAARGERIVNRIPSSVRSNFLKADILKRLRKSNYDELGFPPELCAEIDRIDMDGALGEVRKGFESLRLKIEPSILKKLELEARDEDAKSDRPDYDDIENLV